MIGKMEESEAFTNATLLDSQGKVLFPLEDKTVNPNQENIGSVFTIEAPYFASEFQLKGKEYLLKITEPTSEMKGIGRKIEFLFFGILILLPVLLIIVSQILIGKFSKSVRQVVHAISPYREGKTEFPARIEHEVVEDPDFSDLALTLNALTEQIYVQVENLKKQKDESEEILESLSEGVIATDIVGRVIFINKSALKILEVSRGGILKKNLSAIDDELGKHCSQMVENVLGTQKSRTETIARSKSSQVYLDLISTPLAGKNGVLIVLQDKTSEYTAVEIGKDFVAHELRTPITIIRGFAETLQDLPEISQKMLLEITEKIVYTCIRLEKIVKSLLLLTELENLSKDRMTTIDLILLVENCQRTLLEAYPNVHIAFHTELSHVMIHGETDLIELAVLNILENAVKYSSDKARIDISMSFENSFVVLKIKDHGVGIAKDQLAHVFDRFYTVDKARSRKLGGAGLGLSIVKTIIEKHRGQVFVDSTLNEGTTFTISLPGSTSVSAN